MPRAMWSGNIVFGLVNIPVRLLPATRRKDVRFHELDRATGRPVHHQRVVDAGDADQVSRETWAVEPQNDAVSRETWSFERPSPRAVPIEEIVKGYEVAPGSFVTLEPEEIEELQPERTKTIDIEEFVPAGQVDPVHFDTAYQVVPRWEFERPFALLVEALAASERLAIAWIVLRKRRHLAALRPYQGLLLLTTLYFADEVLEPARRAPEEKPGERELKMAALLIEQMAGDFDPNRYEDGYRKKLLELIASRAGEAVTVEEPPEPAAASGVAELMAALEASLERVKADRKPKQRMTDSG